jgi:D-sedoheptulose 7-phosphate isomerase
VASLSAGGTLITCGNGGSAADSQHIAAELGGKFYRVRPGVPAVSLTVNTSMITAIGNDFGYDEVFSRQLEAIGRPGDVLLAISTSGNSANVVKAVEYARTRGIRTIGLTGRTGGKLKDLCDLLIGIPSDDTPRVQEGHIAVGHLLCELVETALFPDPGSDS